MANLYELTGEYLELLQMAEGGEFDAETIMDTLDGITGEIEAKADGYGKVIKSLENDISGVDGYISGLKAEIERLSNKKKSLNNNIALLKSNLLKSMQATETKNIKTPLFTFYMSKQTALDIYDDSIVPSQFKIEQAPKTDTRAVKEYLKENGNTAWASLKNYESLRMR